MYLNLNEKQILNYYQIIPALIRRVLVEIPPCQLSCCTRNTNLP